MAAANPDWSVDEFADAYNRKEGTNLSRSTMGRALSRLGFKRKNSPWSPRTATPNVLRPGARVYLKRSEPSPLRIWCLWAKPGTR